MRSHFLEYYKKNETELNTLWNNSLFVFDANVLLNFYRYSQNAQSLLFTILDKLSNRIWIPHQSALEYHKNKYSVIEKQEKSFHQVKHSIDKGFNELMNDLNQFQKHLTIDIKEINQQISKLQTSLNKKLIKLEKEHKENVNYDEINLRIANLFENRVGRCYNQDELDEIYKKGEIRYQSEIPPGFMDSKSKGNKVSYHHNICIQDKYGDYILWQQTIEKAKELETSIIFITDDVKSDWWLRSNGKTTGPHPHLIYEFNTEVKKDFHMYNTERFVEYADYFLMDEHKNIDNVLSEYANIRVSNSQRMSNAIQITDTDNTYVLIGNHTKERSKILIERTVFKQKIVHKYSLDIKIINYIFNTILEPILRKSSTDNLLEIQDAFIYKLIEITSEDLLLELVKAEILNETKYLTMRGMALILDLYNYHVLKNVDLTNK